MSDTIVTTFCYDWCNHQNGLSYCITPFYLAGYGLIKTENELDGVLTAFRTMEATNSGQSIIWKELAIHRLEQLDNFVEKEIRSNFSPESQLVPTFTHSRSGNKIWNFVIDKGKVVGII